MSSIKKRADIQGWRAIAVLMVIANHFVSKKFTGGFIGVDIFFVISGYLIGWGLVNQIENGSLNLTDFYARRVRRLLPNLFLVLIISLLVFPAILNPSEQIDFYKSITAVGLLYSNYHFYADGGYFGGPSELKPLLHTWSLSIEEQFYLLLPAILVLTWKYLKSVQYLLLSIVGVLLVSLTYSEFTLYKYNIHTAYLLFSCRLFELATGSAIASFQYRGRIQPSISNIPLLAGVGLFGMSFSLTEFSHFPGITAFFICCLTSFALYFKSESKLLTNKLVVHLGDLSYSLYLWHWPILVYVRHYLLIHTSSQEIPYTWFIPVLLVIYCVALLCYLLVEKPFLSKNSYLTKNISTKFLYGCLILFSISSGIIALLDSSYSNWNMSATSSDLRKKCHNVDNEDRRCVIGDTSKKATIAVWGDSHGLELAQGLSDILKYKHIAAKIYTFSECPAAISAVMPQNEKCTDFTELAKRSILNDPNISTVILAAYFDNYKTIGKESQMFEQFKLVSNELKQKSKYSIVMKQVPPLQMSALTANYFKLEASMSYNEYRLKFDKWNKFLETNFDATIDPSAPLCGLTTICKYSSENRALVYYFDTNHLSLEGIQLLYPQIYQILKGVPSSKTSSIK